MCAISSDPSDGFVSVREFQLALAGRPTSLAGPAGAPRGARGLGRSVALPGQVVAWLAVFLALAFAAATVFATLPRGQATDRPTNVPAAVAPDPSPGNDLRPGSDIRQAVGAELAPAGTREP